MICDKCNEKTTSLWIDEDILLCEDCSEDDKDYDLLMTTLYSACGLQNNIKYIKNVIFILKEES